MESMKTKEEKENVYDSNLTLLREYRNGNREAGEKLAVQNKALVYKIAGKFTGRGVDIEELVETGNIGLVKAINTFDFSRECAFSTYAVPLIFGEIRRFLRDDGIIKVSRENKRLSAMICKERERRLNLGLDASLAAVAEALGVSKEDCAMAAFSTGSVRSLDEAAFDDEDSVSLGACVYDEDAEEKEFDKLALRLAVEKLGSFEKTLILLRYFRDFSQAKTAEIMGLSQVKVSRAEKKILASLKNLMQ
jgi:RNA polymerase sporulation-specific sigma factor